MTSVQDELKPGLFACERNVNMTQKVDKYYLLFTDFVDTMGDILIPTANSTNAKVRHLCTMYRGK